MRVELGMGFGVCPVSAAFGIVKFVKTWVGRSPLEVTKLVGRTVGAEPMEEAEEPQRTDDIFLRAMRVAGSDILRSSSVAMPITAAGEVPSPFLGVVIPPGADVEIEVESRRSDLVRLALYIDGLEAEGLPRMELHSSPFDSQPFALPFAALPVSPFSIISSMFGRGLKPPPRSRVEDGPPGKTPEALAFEREISRFGAEVFGLINRRMETGKRAEAKEEERPDPAPLMAALSLIENLHAEACGEARSNWDECVEDCPARIAHQGIETYLADAASKSR